MAYVWCVCRGDAGHERDAAACRRWVGSCVRTSRRAQRMNLSSTNRAERIDLVDELERITSYKMGVKDAQRKIHS